MKNLLILALLIVTGTTSAQIGAKTQQSLTGAWQNSDMGFQMVLILNLDGSGEFDGEAIRYKTQGNQLSITQQGFTNNYTYSLQQGRLTLSGGDLDSPITFTRVGATEPATSTEPVYSGAAVPKNPETPIAESSNEALLGPWSAGGEVIDFKANGQCQYMGQMYPYQVSGNMLTLVTNQGNLSMNYAVQGNQLTLMANGKNVVFTKGAVASSATAGQSNGSARVAQELVGKWCFVDVTRTNTGGSTSEECIELRADGSYVYYAERSMDTNTSAFWAGTNSTSNDQGTWTYDGNRIYYNSQSRGQGSYQLVKQNHPRNGDPMIVLDGKSYVTHYQKSPW